MRLDEILEEAANRQADSPFLLAGGEPVTYGEALARSNGLCWLLSELGVRHGSRVAVILPNSPEMVYTWFALARLGAVMVPINPALVQPEVEPVLRNLGVMGLIADAKTVALYSQCLDLRVRLVAGAGEVEVEDAVRFAAPPRPSAPSLPWKVSPEDVVTILQSSGTTGQPKCAALSHLSYVLPAREFVRWMEAVPGDRFLGCLPLFHMAGQAFAASAVAAGASLALVGRFSAHHFWEQVRAQGITVVRHLGEMLALLCRQPEQPDDLLHPLRAVYGGGARPDVIEEFERRFGVPVVEGYGLTETNTVLRNELSERRRGSIGRPLAYAEVRVADEQGVALPPRQIGEIQVWRDPVMMPGYVGPAELNAAASVAGWFRTGDLGYHDEEGYFYFAGRQKDLIRRRGENIYPGSIEKVLDRHPAVDASAVVGVPDDLGGEEVKAYLVCRPGTDLAAEELVAWCRPWLADFEIPRYFEICAELPRTATNKINKSQLRLAGTAGGPCYDRKSEADEPPAPYPLAYDDSSGAQPVV
ncbi:MAG TPA: AMP-binding protein [Thermoanaerobaculia bacterium]|nr:AMP-binding protein [Thermoanaerobaculia bacterium]